MKIRSVTSFIHVDQNGNIQEKELNQLDRFNKKIIEKLQESEFEVQSLRCATNPFPEYLSGITQREALQRVQKLEADLQEIGYDYISVGSASAEQTDCFSLIPELIQVTESVFATAQMVVSDTPKISIGAIKAISSIIKKLSTQDENGFGNLFFAALAKVPGGIPFLPAAYKSANDQQLSFSLAMESADLAVMAFTGAETLQEAGYNYRYAVENSANRLEAIVSEVCMTTNMKFLGFDFTPAPFIQPESSAGGALEILSGSPIGELSSVSAAAFLMSALDSAQFRRSGFNGLMLPVLEDSVLAQGANNGKLTLKDLLLYSTVCGTGLDTVPLPGDISEAQLQAILLDVASLAVRLNKPLTARLMPIPRKKAGEMTSFDFPYFTNSRVLSPDCDGLSGLLATDSTVTLNPRN